jgi:hypothetical protein
MDLTTATAYQDEDGNVFEVCAQTDEGEDENDVPTGNYAVAKNHFAWMNGMECVGPIDSLDVVQAWLDAYAAKAGWFAVTGEAEPAEYCSRCGGLGQIESAPGEVADCSVCDGSGNAPGKTTLEPSETPEAPETATEPVQTLKLESRRYRRPGGDILLVAQGIGRPDGDESQWGTFTQKPNGSLHRITSKNLPMVADRDEAQSNLNQWAQGQGLSVVEDMPEQGAAPC